jgi:hypothetical protein
VAEADAAWWRGRLFPNDCTDRDARFETPPDPVTLRRRNLPTRDVMEEAGAYLGARALPLLSRWRTLWEDAVGDVEAYAAETGGGLEFEAWRAATLDDARTLHGEGKVLDACQRTVDALRGTDGRVRARALHAIEDAGMHVALAGSDLAVVVNNETDPGQDAQAVGKLAGERGFRILAGPAHAAMGRRARTARWAADRADTPYWSCPAFRERAGRAMALARTHPELLLVLADMARQGHRKAFLKAAESKAGTWLVDLDGDPIRQDAILSGTLGHAYHRFVLGLRRRRMLVQEWTPFVREHRFFVVGHRVVASTPSTRSACLLDAGPGILGRGVAELAAPALVPGSYDRGETRTVVDRPLLARMARGARDLARALGREPGASGNPDRSDCYVIDMGLSADGRVLPIEVNGFQHAGLYALDYGRVVRALERRSARQGATTAEAPAPSPRQGMAAGTDGIVDLDAQLREIMLDVDDTVRPIPPREIPEAADLPPGHLARAPYVRVYAPAGPDWDATAREWGRGRMPDRWTTTRPAGEGWSVRGIAAGADVLPGARLRPGAAVVLEDMSHADGCVRGIAPFAGLHTPPGRFRAARGTRRDDVIAIPQVRMDELLAFLDVAHLADRAAELMPAYERGALVQSFALDNWRRVEPILRATVPGLDLSGMGAALAGFDPARYGQLRKPWQERVRAECLSNLERERNRLVTHLRRSGNGSVNLSVEFPMRGGALVETLARMPLGRRWRPLYRADREHEHESPWPNAKAKKASDVAIVCLEARVAVSAVDLDRTLVEGALWHCDLDAVHLKAGASVLLTGAWFAGTSSAHPEFEAVARRYLPVDDALGETEIAA